MISVKTFIIAGTAMLLGGFFCGFCLATVLAIGPTIVFPAPLAQAMADSERQYKVTGVVVDGLEASVSIVDKADERYVFHVVQEFGESDDATPAISLKKGDVLSVQDSFLDNSGVPVAIFKTAPHAGKIIRPVPAIPIGNQKGSPFFVQ